MVLNPFSSVTASPPFLTYWKKQIGFWWFNTGLWRLAAVQCFFATLCSLVHHKKWVGSPSQQTR
jgi:hypothetical protein